MNTVLQIISYLYSRRADNADKIFYMLNTPGFSLVYTDTMDGDTEMAGFVNSVSIVVSMITMTALMMALA